MLNILRQIHQEQTNIDQELQVPNKKLEFFQEFFKKYPYGVMKSYYEIDKCDLIIASLAASDSSLPIDTIIDAITSNKPIIDILDMDTYQTLAETYIKLMEFNAVEEVTAIIQSGIRPSKEDCEQYMTADLASILMSFAENMGVSCTDFAKLLQIFEYELTLDENDKFVHKHLPLMQAIGTKRLLDETKESYTNFTETLGDAKYKKVASPSLKKTAKGTIQNLKNGINEHIDILKTYHEVLISNDKARKKKLIKDKQQYETVEHELYQLMRFPETIATDKTISKLSNPAIRMAALKVIYSHNLVIYQQCEQEYKELAANDASNYRILLANYGLAPSDYEVGTIMNNPLSDVEQMLEQLQRIDIKAPSVLLSILQTSNLETITNYTSLVQKGIITTSSLADNLTVLDPTSRDYENMMRNLASIQHKKVNPRYFSTTLDALLTDHQLFKANLETLETYELLPTLKTGINSSFMGIENLREAIDTLLELGYEKNLEEKIELLNYKDKFNRLRLLKTLNMEVSTTEELENVLTTDKFFVPDSMIDEYLYNAVPYHLPTPIGATTHKKTPDLSKLSEFQSTPRTYTIGGVIISKNKVANNLSSSKQFNKQSNRLLHSILSGSVLTDQEVESVITTLSDKKILVKK